MNKKHITFIKIFLSVNIKQFHLINLTPIKQWQSQY